MKFEELISVLSAICVGTTMGVVLGATLQPQDVTTFLFFSTIGIVSFGIAIGMMLTS